MILDTDVRLESRSQTPSYTRQSEKQIRSYILEINENATLVFSIPFQHGLVYQKFVFIRQLYFTYAIKRSFFALIDCQYALFKSNCSKKSYLTIFYVPHE